MCFSIRWITWSLNVVQFCSTVNPVSFESKKDEQNSSASLVSSFWSIFLNIMNLAWWRCRSLGRYVYLNHQNIVFANHKAWHMVNILNQRRVWCQKQVNQGVGVVLVMGGLGYHLTRAVFGSEFNQVLAESTLTGIFRNCPVFPVNIGQVKISTMCFQRKCELILKHGCKG